MACTSLVINCLLLVFRYLGPESLKAGFDAFKAYLGRKWKSFTDSTKAKLTSIKDQLKQNIKDILNSVKNLLDSTKDIWNAIWGQRAEAEALGANQPEHQAAAGLDADRHPDAPAGELPLEERFSALNIEEPTSLEEGFGAMHIE